MLRRVGRFAFIAAALLVLAAALTSPVKPALYPPRPGDERALVVVDHGYHAGLLLRAADLRAAAMAVGRRSRRDAHILRSITEGFRDAQWLEIGWGDEGFYRDARTIDDVTAPMVARALLMPSASVLQVVALPAHPARYFPAERLTPMTVSTEGLTALAAALAATFATDRTGTPRRDGVSLYGDGAFFPARPSYHLFNTCNHWLSGLLRRAGLPSSWLWSATSKGLTGELAWRLGN